MGYFKWKPSKAAKQEFAAKMREVETFCDEKGIGHSASYDSFYFWVADKFYRVSNHSIEASNRAAFDPVTHEQRRELYHEWTRDPEIVYIHASKTRLIEIYNALSAGLAVDGRGYVRDV